MKKTLAILSLLASVAVTYGQGTVLFSTTASAGTRFSTNAVVGGSSAGQGAALGTTGYYFALFYSTTGATTVSGSSAAVTGAGTYAFNGSGNWTYVANGANTTGGGRLAADVSAQNSDGSTTIPTIGASATAELVVVGWSANIGSTYQQLQAYLANPTLTGWVGESAVASIVLGNAPGSGGSQTPVSLFGTGAGQVGGLLLGEIVPTPEPATMVLAGLGGLSLLALRRKK